MSVPAVDTAWRDYLTRWGLNAKTDLAEFERDDFEAGYAKRTTRTGATRNGRDDRVTWSDRLHGLSDTALEDQCTPFESAWSIHARARGLSRINPQSVTYMRARNVFKAGWATAERPDSPFILLAGTEITNAE